MHGLAFAVLARPHRLAIDGDVACVVACGKVQRAENVGQSPRIDGPHGLGQRGMTRGRSIHEAERIALACGHGTPQQERRLEPPSSAQKPDDD